MLKSILRSDIHTVLTPKIVIWRPLFVYNGVMTDELNNKVYRQPGDHKQGNAEILLRVNLIGSQQDICEPCVSTSRRGLVCFLRGNLPECWTHLVVIGNGANGNTLKAIAECLPDVSAYIEWRKQISLLYHSPKRYTEAQLSKLIENSPCPGLPTNRERVQLFQSDDSNYHCHV